MIDIYKYKKPDKKAFCTKVKNISFEYIKKEDFSEKNHIILGKTDFKKAKENEPSLLLEDRLFLIENLSDDDIIDGYICTENNEFVAFKKQKNNYMFIFFLFLFLFLLIYLFINEKNSDIENKPVWIIGGEEGTDININGPKATQSYNTYWGYQNITITEGMTVPFVNKEENSSYAQFIIYDKEGNDIWSSELIKPGTHTEWDAYTFYNGESGEYLHDLKVIFYNPIYDNNGAIEDFEASLFVANTPDFKITIQ